MDKLISLMMDLIKSEICGNSVDPSCAASLSAEEIGRLYSISKSHDMSHLVGSALSRNKIFFENEYDEKFSKQSFIAVYRYENINYELTQICTALENARIEFIPLKGSVLRRYYPEAWQRTSCDIDILVRESELARAEDCFVKNLGYSSEGKGRHDISLQSPSKVHVELHYSLIEDDAIGDANGVLLDVWSFARQVEDSEYKREMSDEMFYYYHLAHMAKHFVQGGCGIRPFLDLWILNHRSDFDASARRALLEKGGLSLFAQRCDELSEVWFGDKAHSDVTAQMQEYLLGGGVYGNLSNRVAVEQSKKGGKASYALSRIWLKYDLLKFHYPSLEGRKWLIPIYQVRRWGKLIFCGGFKRSARELRVNASTSQDKISDTATLLDSLGL